MRTIVDCHSIFNNKTTGYERFARAVLPVLATKIDCNLFSVGSGSVARSLNFLPLMVPCKGENILFPTNPPLIWKRKYLKSAIFIVHDIFPLINPDMCQSITAKIYRHFLEDILEFGLVTSVSIFTSLEIQKYYSKKLKIPVIGNHVEARRSDTIPFNLRFYLKKKYKNYFLTVGTIEPRKNHQYLLEEYSDYRKNTKNPFNLLIFGRRGWKSDLIIRKILSTKGVYWIEKGSDDLLWAAYSEAEALVSTSHYEGFNMPAFEALATGKTVILPADSAPTFEHEGFLTFRFEPKKLTKILINFKNYRSNQTINSFGSNFVTSKYTGTIVANNISKLLGSKC